MVTVEMYFDGRWIMLVREPLRRDDAEWLVGRWKRENKMSGDPFRYRAANQVNPGADTDVQRSEAVAQAESN